MPTIDRFDDAVGIGGPDEWVGLAVVLALPGPAPALEMRPILTLDVARTIVDGCLTKVQQQGLDLK